MIFDEGISKIAGEDVSIQCLLQNYKQAPLIENFRLHYHKYIELVYFLEGSARALVNEESAVCQKGDLFIVYSGEPHVYEQLTDNKCVVIKFLPDILRTSGQRLSETEYAFNFNLNSHSRLIRGMGDAIEGYLLDAYKKYNEQSYANELFIRADIIRVCAEIVNFWYKNGEIYSLASVAGRDAVQCIQNIMKQASAVYGNIKTHEAAMLCNMSDGHFSRTFKSVMNMTFTQYARSVKLAEAQRSLTCTDDSVTDIAQKLGYASTSHFIEDFKKEKGISPKQYKKMVLS